ncbi:hypothetical protein Trco_008522 [Trichoderma cornu-damae]|uniref:Peroxisomal membrane protein PEX16 n=1 Tax=Trichoderma cornu-damae TaxID=654480 RepID=A0A9P8QI40_9HYPO|nr:hypothetical protein Trco_008522 [Trichoderma cornu-damae]
MAANPTKPAPNRPPRRVTVGQILSIPPKWLAMYDEFITKNAGQVSQIESALRSLTYIIPGRFRDAEIASESIHSGVQLLSLYHDGILSRAVSKLPTQPARSAHARYTRYWAQRSGTYRRIAVVLQMVVYTELLCEMSAKRRGGERTRWNVIVLLEAIKAFCRLPIPEEEPDDDDDDATTARSESELMDETSPNGSAVLVGRRPQKLAYEKEWTMPRTGMSLPSLPSPGDISSYLLGRVLTADDIKPASKLLNQLQGGGQFAEMLHILTPLVYAVALARTRDKKSWTPWLVGVAIEYAARQLRQRSLRTSALERDEWNKRGWAMIWWAMRGAFYENVTKGAVNGVTRRMPGFIAGILQDYEYLWENYYFSTSA